MSYKGFYCPIKQYMPKKPKKWYVKLWILVHFVSKYVYNFETYCGKNAESNEGLSPLLKVKRMQPMWW